MADNTVALTTQEIITQHHPDGPDGEVPIDPNRPLGTAEVAKLLGTSPGLISQWTFRDSMPLVDWIVGKRPAWKFSTIYSFFRVGEAYDHLDVFINTQQAEQTEQADQGVQPTTYSPRTLQGPSK